jgi:serine/threonine protein kinase
MRASATTIGPLGIAILRARARLQIPNSPYTSRFMSYLPANLDVGTTIGDYQIVSVLGRGGMGKVFKVRNLLSDRIEAMKVLLPGLDPSPELVERFLREIRVVAGLEHPGIAALRTALRVDNQILMIMEYVEGNSLHQMLQQGRIETTRAVRFTRQVLEALGYAHRRGVVHRDVKPPNILVDLDDRIKLTDFGIASRSGDPKLTGAGIALGSLHYMSPEQMKAEALDARSDLYSVGVTLYEMVTGQTPVQGSSYYAILKAHLEDKPRSAAELVPELAPELSRIIDKSLAKMPSARFQTAEEFQAALIELDRGGSSEPAAPRRLREQAVSSASLPRSATPAPGTPVHMSANVESTPPTAMKSDVGVKSWDPAVLENVRKNLAVYVGPMAKVLVNRAARNARNLEDLYRVLATEIASPADREKFLRSQPL